MGGSTSAAKRGLRPSWRCLKRQPHGPPWEAQSLGGGPHWSTPFPSHVGPYPSEGSFGAQSFSFPLFDPILSLEDLRPGPVHPRLLCRPPWLLGPLGSDAEAAAPSSQVCTHSAAPAPHTDASSGLPSRTSPWKPPQPSTASGLRPLSPPAPGRCPSRCSWVPSMSGPCPALRPAGDSRQQEKEVRTETGMRPHFSLVILYFSRLKSIH